MKRICKSCKKSKDYHYLCLNTQGRAVYKSEDGGLWHGLRCYVCHLNYVKLQANLPALGAKSCPVCAKEFIQNSARHKFCGKGCKKVGLLEEVGDEYI